MKRKVLLASALLPLAVLLLQCKKDKHDKPENSINLTKGLLAVFKMNDEFDDSTGNIPIAAYSSTGIKAVADRNGNAKSAMYFEEGKMFATVNEWSANPITVSCWVLPKDNINDNFFLRAGSAVFGFYQHNTSIGFTISTPATETAMTALGDGWIQLTGTYDGNDIRTYINGQLKETLHHPGEPGTTNEIEIGSVDAPYWRGVIDEVRFYNRLLSEEEIAALVNL